MTQFAELLSRSGVQVADLEKAQSYQQKYGGRLEQILVNMGSLSSDSLPGIYSALLGFPVLSTVDIQKWEPLPNVDDFPLEFLVSRGWVPLRTANDGVLVFATRAPLDLEVNDWLRSRSPSFDLVIVSSAPESPQKADVAAITRRTVDVEPGDPLTNRYAGFAIESQRPSEVESRRFQTYPVTKDSSAGDLAWPPV